MAQVKRLLQTTPVRIVLAILFIGVAVVFSLFLPKESDPNIGLGTDPSTPTVDITNPVGTLAVNHSVHFQSVTLTITRVEEAGAFSDDRRRAGKYTVRVLVHEQPDASIQAPMGIKYDSLVHLVLLDGQSISPKLISLPPVVLPQETRDGFFDFPVNTQVPLASLTLRLGNDTSVGFSG